jgi:hypothetical protein
MRIQQRHGQIFLDVEDGTFSIRFILRKCYKIVHYIYIYIEREREGLNNLHPNLLC